MADLNAKGVQEMLNELGWKILGKGEYKGFGNQAAISVENRVAIPEGVMRAKGSGYGEHLSPEDTAKMGLKGTYRVVGMNSGEAKQTIGPDGKPQTVQAPMKVALDDIGAKEVVKMIEGAIACGKSLDKVDRMIGAARSSGETVEFDRNAYKKQIATALISGGKVKVSGVYTTAAPMRPSQIAPPPPVRTTPQRERVR